MEILKNFGFEPGFFIAQIVNFLILAFVFKKYLYKPLLKVLNDRQEKIKTGLDEANQAHEALEKANVERDQLLQEAAREAEKILIETKAASEKIKEDMLSESKKAAEKILSAASSQAKLEMERIQKEAKNLALDISKKVLDKVIEDMFTKEEKDKILKRNIQRLEKYE